MKSLHFDRSLCSNSTEGDTGYIYLSRSTEVADILSPQTSCQHDQSCQLIDQLETITGLQQGFE